MSRIWPRVGIYTRYFLVFQKAESFPTLCTQDLFDPDGEILDGEDEASREEKMKRTNDLKDEWARYCAITTPDVDTLADVARFWQDR